MNNRCFIIAEAGVNHNGKIKLAERLVDAGKAAGADAVKFQTFRADSLVSAGAPLARYQRGKSGGASQLEMIRALELSEADHRILLKRCGRAGIEFMSTPFDEASADMLVRLGVKRLKIPSGEITNKRLIEHVARKGKPVILSTGMSTLAEVRKAVGWILKTRRVPLTVLHCVTEYPAPAAQVNLRAMDSLRAATGLPVGYSDHTLGVEVAVASAARGATVLEKHLTLDRSLPGPDHAASLEPREFARMVAAIRLVESALGDGVKRPAPCERKNISVARRG
ncbi:MAG: N-acetylneuraminate synthase, partial [Elusimicrobia bacterium CG11_big_fil_rev_8_21_14_0_20_64_6]